MEEHQESNEKSPEKFYKSLEDAFHQCFKKVRDKDKHTDTKDEAQKELMDKMCLQSKYHTLKM